MVNKKSLANLKRGNSVNVGRKKGKTWSDLIIEYGETPSDTDPTRTHREMVIASAYRQAELGNAGMLRELMQRSEPQDTNVNVKGKLALFNYAIIDRLIARRPEEDSSKP